MGRHIGLIGPKHSGKTTAANYLLTRGFTRLGLADPLKDTAVAMLNIFHARENLPDIDRAFLDKNKDVVFVPFLQWLGTEYGREFLRTPLRWTQKFLDVAAASEMPVVCDDIRYINEAAMLSQSGFLLVRIQRLEAARLRSLSISNVPVATALHKSETELEQIKADIVLDPSESVESLYEHIQWCVDFQSACQSLTEMMSYVPYNTAPGFNADFSEQVERLFLARNTLELHITSEIYTYMWERMLSHISD